MIKKFLLVEDPNRERKPDHDGLEIVGVFDTEEQAFTRIKGMTFDAVQNWGSSEGFKLGLDPNFSSHYRIYEFVAEVVPKVKIAASIGYDVGELGSRLPTQMKCDRREGRSHRGRRRDGKKTRSHSG